jgi:hypothetical protein
MYMSDCLTRPSVAAFSAAAVYLLSLASCSVVQARGWGSIIISNWKVKRQKGLHRWLADDQACMDTEHLGDMPASKALNIGAGKVLSAWGHDGGLTRGLVGD